MQVTYAPDKPQLFWLWEKQEDPQFEPHAGIKMAEVLGSPLYICDINTGFIAYISKKEGVPEICYPTNFDINRF